MKSTALLITIMVLSILFCNCSQPSQITDCGNYTYKIVTQFGVPPQHEVIEVSQQEFWQKAMSYEYKYKSDESCTIYGFVPLKEKFMVLIPTSKQEYSYFEVSSTVFWAIENTMDTYNLYYGNGTYSLILDVDVLPFIDLLYGD